MKNDPIVSEIRRHRDRLAAKFNYDLEAIFADVRARQTTSGHRVILKKGGKAHPAARPGHRHTP